MKKTSIVFAFIAILASIFVFTGCSFDSNYLTAYAKYLAPYVSAAADGEIVGLKFIDDKSAIVSIGQAAYPCYVQAKDEDSFELTNNLESSQDDDISVVSKQEEQPSVFYVDFWENNATVSWSILGVKVEKVLSITEGKDIPAGIWKLFATKHGDEELVYKENGAGWTVILENGESYTGEGMDSAWVTKFISINDCVFQCLFDAKSGVIMDASLVTYDTTTFGYPVMIERYISDGLEEPHYFYSRLLREDEKTDFSGGTFTAGAVAYEAEIKRLPNDDVWVDRLSKWQLMPEKEADEKILNMEATLDLNADQTVRLEVTGDKKYSGKATGTWYALQHSVLVVLDETSPLVGKTFTLFVQDSAFAPNEEEYIKEAKSSLDLFKCYKLGVVDYDYYVMKEDVEIFWGSQYANGNISPKLVYEKKYVLNALWFEPYYTDKDFSWEAYDSNVELTPFPGNGNTYIVFHENGTFDFTYSTGVTRQYEYTLEPYIDFDPIRLYSEGRERLSVPFLNLGFESLSFYSSVMINEQGFRICAIEFLLTED